LLAICRKGNIPDIGAAAGIQRTHDVFVVGILVAAQKNCLVRIESGNFFQGFLKAIDIKRSTVHDNGSIGFDIEDYFSRGSTGFFALAGLWHLHVHLGFRAGDVPLQEKKEEQEESNINHRGDLKSRRIELDGPAKIHFQSRYLELRWFVTICAIKIVQAASRSEIIN
jgi:hypothetical protein